MEEPVEIKKVQYFENIHQPIHREFIKAQCQCTLCGTELELNHTSDQELSTIREEAYCPQCTLKTRNKVFQLH